VLSFEAQHTRQDQSYNRGAESTFAGQLRAKYAGALAKAVAAETPTTAQAPSSAPAAQPESSNVDPSNIAEEPVGERPVDTLGVYQKLAIECLRNDAQFKQQMESGLGIPWGAVIGILEKGLPDSMQDRGSVAHNLVLKPA
jgi:hypothetical protein